MAIVSAPTRLRAEKVVKLKTVNVTLVVAASLLSLDMLPVANAGTQYTSNVVVVKYPVSGGYAYGSLKDARASNSPYEAIGCEVTAREQFNRLYCFARDKDRVTAQCFKLDPPASVLEALSGVNEGSRLQFRYSRVYGISYPGSTPRSFDQCGEIRVGTYSLYF